MWKKVHRNDKKKFTLRLSKSVLGCSIFHYCNHFAECWGASALVLAYFCLCGKEKRILETVWPLLRKTFQKHIKIAIKHFLELCCHDFLYEFIPTTFQEFFSYYWKKCKIFVMSMLVNIFFSSFCYHY